MADATISLSTLVAGTTTSSGFQEVAAPGRLTRTFAAPRPVVGHRLPSVPHRLVRRLDTALRRFHGVREFSERPDCLLRIAIGCAAADARLADGSDVARGAQVIDLHLWNEHLADLPPLSIGLGRASALRRQFGASFCELAGYIKSEPSQAASRLCGLAPHWSRGHASRSCFVSPERMASTLSSRPEPILSCERCTISGKTFSFGCWHGPSTQLRCAGKGWCGRVARSGFRAMPLSRGTRGDRRSGSRISSRHCRRLRDMTSLVPVRVTSWGFARRASPDVETIRSPVNGRRMGRMTKEVRR